MPRECEWQGTLSADRADRLWRAHGSHSGPRYGRYERLGSTLDDAAGEAFDKVARMLRIGLPRWPGNRAGGEEWGPAGFRFARAWLPGTYDFSFSGLKTAVLRVQQRYAGLSILTVSTPIWLQRFKCRWSMCLWKTARAAKELSVNAVLLSGGMSASAALRRNVRSEVAIARLYTAPDSMHHFNAAMIAAAGYFRFQAGERAGWDLDIEPGLQ